ncbi:beta-galactosidase trimerization domain protein [Leptospira interrogans serovar Icterohaemorrhagiae str. Verdun HP]|uniref:Beta-galactosidase trimerization domain protein n=1 Tax=Leptospira interrogans serovar Icterohaemorrhagiae str. Verdun HP TaxID=1049910 RepID=M6RXT9_LEPIR|nr:beta-galactosidase trimerization domain protein [Leptospira interrogans serovar Icterohaemorrhagiae str. Verdun HP]
MELLVLGFRTGAKDLNGWMYDSQIPGPFAEMAGIKIRKFESVGNQKVKFRFVFFRELVLKFVKF